MAAGELFEVLRLAGGHFEKAAIVEYDEGRHALCICDLKPDLLQPRKQRRVDICLRAQRCLSAPLGLPGGLTVQRQLSAPFSTARPRPPSCRAP